MSRIVRGSAVTIGARGLICAAGAVWLTDAIRATVIGDSSTTGINFTTAASAVLDEVGHLGTGVILLGALAVSSSRRFAAGLLAASVLIDLDHIPQYAGTRWLTQGTPRPYPHSLITVALVGLVALIARRDTVRAVALGATVGLLGHLFRDMAEPNSGVALLWPFTKRAFSLPYSVFCVVLVTLLAIGVVRRRVASPGHSLYRAHSR